MGKSANDNMMTRPQPRGCSGTPHPACVLSWYVERKSPVGSLQEQSPRLGVWTGDEVPKSLSVFINFKQIFLSPVI